MKKLLFILAFLLCVASRAESANFYWANTAGGAANCAAADSTSRDTDPGAYLTVAQAVACITPGDGLVLKAGTYSQNWQTTLPRGTSWSAPVTLDKAAGETVTLTGNLTWGGNPADPPTANYIWIRGRSKTDRIIHTATAAGFTNGQSKLRFHYIDKSNPVNANNNCFGAFWGNDTNVNMDSQFVGNWVHQCGRDKTLDPDGLKHGMYLTGTGLLIEDNDIEIGTTNMGYGLHMQGLNTTIAPIIVRNNRIRRNGAGTGGMIINNAGGVEIYGNEFYSEGGPRGCLRIWKGGGNKVWNNSFFNCGTQAIIVDHSSSTGSNNNEIRNNLMGGTGGKIVIADAISTGNIVTHNTWQTNITNNGTSTVLASNNTRTPVFINSGATPPDFCLPEGSPEIDAGIDVGLPFNGARPDIGRCEFVGSGGGPPDPPPVGGHQSSVVTTATPNVINLTFVPVATAISGCDPADFPVVINGTSRTVTGLVMTGDFTADLTFGGAALLNGQTPNTNAYTGPSCVSGVNPIAPWTAQNIQNQVDVPPPDPPVGGFSGGGVEPGTPAVVNLTWQSTVNPITDCDATQFSRKRNGTPATGSSLVQTGPSTTAITFPSDALTGETLLLSYTGPSCKAGTQTIAAFTDQLLENHITAPATFSFDGLEFRFRDVRAAANNPTWKVAANANYSTFPGGIVRIRYVAACAGGPCSPVAIGFIRSINGAGYGAVNDGVGSSSACSNSTICMYRGIDSPDIPVDGAATSQQLGTGNFVGGQSKRKNDVLYTTPLMQTGDEIEMEGIFAVQPTAAIGTTIDVNLLNENTGAALATGNIPRITVVTPSAGTGQ